MPTAYGIYGPPTPKPKSKPPKRWPSEAEQVASGKHPFRGVVKSVVRKPQEDTTMAGKRGVSDLVVAASRTGVVARLKRGAVITTIGMVAFGVVSVFVPFVPLVVGVAVGGIAGGAVANATAKKG